MELIEKIISLYFILMPMIAALLSWLWWADFVEESDRWSSEPFKYIVIFMLLSPVLIPFAAWKAVFGEDEP